MKTILTLTAILLLSACSSQVHDKVIDATEKCKNGAHSITHSELTEGNTTTVVCK